MRAQPGLGVRGVGVGEARAGQDRVALDAGVEALFAQGEALEDLEVVSVCCAAGMG